MKTIIKHLIVCVFSLSFIAGIQAQDDTTGTNDVNSTLKITYDEKSFPKQLKSGESFEFSLLIQNITKFSEWTSNYLTFDNDPNFTVTKAGIWKAVLNPGDSEKYAFKVTAPDTKGMETLKITFYNYGKKNRQITKQIEITGSE